MIYLSPSEILFGFLRFFLTRTKSLIKKVFGTKTVLSLCIAVTHIRRQMDVYSAALANGMAIGNGQKISNFNHEQLPLQPHLRVSRNLKLTSSSNGLLASTTSASAGEPPVISHSPLQREDTMFSDSPEVKHIRSSSPKQPKAGLTSFTEQSTVLPHQKLGLPSRTGGSRIRSKLTNGGKGALRGKGGGSSRGGAGKGNNDLHSAHNLTLDEVLGQRRSIKVEELLTAIGIDYDQLDIADDFRFGNGSVIGGNVAEQPGRSAGNRHPLHHPRDSISRRPSVATAEGGNSSRQSTPTLLPSPPPGVATTAFGRPMLSNIQSAPPLVGTGATSGTLQSPRRHKHAGGGNVPHIKFPAIPAPDAAPSAWKCTLCGYHILAMDNTGRPLAFDVDAWGKPIPTTCPKCLATHLGWSPEPLFDTFGDHANIIAKTANVVRYGAQRQIAPAESVFNNMRRVSVATGGTQTPNVNTSLNAPSQAPLHSVLRKGSTSHLQRSNSSISSNATDATLLPMQQQQLPFSCEVDAKNYQISLGRPHPLSAKYFDDEHEEEEGGERHGPRGRRSIYAPLPGPLQGLANLISPQEGDLAAMEAPSRLRMLYRSAFDTPSTPPPPPPMEGSGSGGASFGNFGGIKSVAQSHAARPPSGITASLGNTFFVGAAFADDLPPRTPRTPHDTSSSKRTRGNRHSTPFSVGEWSGGDQLPTKANSARLTSEEGVLSRTSNSSTAFSTKPFPSRQVAVTEKLRGRRWAFQCTKCGHRLHRMDAYGFLIPLDTGIDGEIVPLQCGGCGVLHSEFVVTPLSHSTKEAEELFAKRRRQKPLNINTAATTNVPTTNNVSGPVSTGTPLSPSLMKEPLAVRSGALADVVLGKMKDGRNSRDGNRVGVQDAQEIQDGSFTHRPM